MDKKSWLLVILVIVGLTACASMQSVVKEPPLPNDINIISPSPNLPKEIAVFSGKWAGTWDIGMSSILVVEEIQDTWGQVVYSQADMPRYDWSAGYKRYKVEVISSPKAKIQFVPSGIKDPDLISFEVMDSNTLQGYMWSTNEDFGSKVIMKRTN